MSPPSDLEFSTSKLLLPLVIFGLLCGLLALMCYKDYEEKRLVLPKVGHVCCVTLLTASLRVFLLPVFLQRVSYCAFSNCVFSLPQLRIYLLRLSYNFSIFLNCLTLLAHIYCDFHDSSLVKFTANSLPYRCGYPISLFF